VIDERVTKQDLGLRCVAADWEVWKKHPEHGVAGTPQFCWALTRAANIHPMAALREE
jgi:hypothetical protein